MKIKFRKNWPLSNWMAGEVADRLFRHLAAHPKTEQAARVEKIVELLSRLGDGDIVAFFQKGDILARYQWHFGLTISSKGLSADLFPNNEMSEEDDWEYRAVYFLMSLVPDRIHRLRRCAYEGCRKWFFAVKREDQRFCRGNCRQNHYDSAPKIRESKKLYMRKYRVEEKGREERGKRRVGFRRRVKRQAKARS